MNNITGTAGTLYRVSKVICVKKAQCSGRKAAVTLNCDVKFIFEVQESLSLKTYVLRVHC